MTDHRFDRAATLSLLAIAFLLGACTSAGLASSPSAPVAPSAVSTAPSIDVVPSASPSMHPSPSMNPATAEPPMAQPPAALIAVEGGDPVVGELGSFTWQNGGSDSPWLPGHRIRVGAGERLLLSLAERVAVAAWQVSYVAAEDLQSTSPVGLAEGSVEPISFPPPPKGTWSVHVSIWFEAGGSAAYYWLTEVT